MFNSGSCRFLNNPLIGWAVGAQSAGNWAEKRRVVGSSPCTDKTWKCTGTPSEHGQDTHEQGINEPETHPGGDLPSPLVNPPRDTRPTCYLCKDLTLNLLLSKNSTKFFPLLGQMKYKNRSDFQIIFIVFVIEKKTGCVSYRR